MKRCHHCALVLGTDEFCIDNSQPDGRREVCRVCASEIYKVWYAQNAEKRKAAVAARYAANAEAIRARKRELYRRSRTEGNRDETSC